MLLTSTATTMTSVDGIDISTLLLLNNKNESSTSMNRIVSPTRPIRTNGSSKFKVDRDWLQKLLHHYCPYDSIRNHPDPLHTKLTAYILAPMVDQSDLPFRLLCRQYGCNVCYTPMIHSKLYCTVTSYRTKFHIQALQADRPLIVQLCGYDPYYMIRAALEMAAYCDAIDINCGCPQNIARRGLYGAYLLEQPHVLYHLIEQMTYHIPIPVTIKLRLLPANHTYRLEKLPTYVESSPPRTEKISSNATTEEEKKIEQENDPNHNNNNTNNNIDTNHSWKDEEALEEEDQYSSEYNNDDTPNNNNNGTKPKKEKGRNNNKTKKKVEDDDTMDMNELEQQRDVSLQKSMELYEQLIQLGIHMITIHGRTRYHKGVNTGKADWDAIQQMVQRFGAQIPIIANGSIGNQHDVQQCLQQTGVDGIMSSEAILEYPPLFHGMYHNDCCGTNHNTNDNNDTTMTTTANSNPKDKSDKEKYYYGPKEYYIGRIQLCYEYLDFAEQYPPDVGGQGSGGVKTMKIHLHRFLHYDLQQQYGQRVRQKLINATSMTTLRECVYDIETIHKEFNMNSNLDLPPLHETWYMRYRQLVRDEYTGITMSQAQYRLMHDGQLNSNMDEILNSDAADCFQNLFGPDDE
jgi:tRNA-dihydrouridine synthase